MLLRDTLLIMDSSAQSRTELRRTFEGRFNILEASTLAQAYMLFDQNRDTVAAVFLEIRMLGAEQRMRDEYMWVTTDPTILKLPRIAIVDTDDVQSEYRAVRMGATDVVFRPYHSVSMEQRISNGIAMYNANWKLEQQVEAQHNTARLRNQAMVESLSALIEERSAESGQHVLRIRVFVKILLDELRQVSPKYGLDDATCEAIASAAVLHDVGKIVIPDAILNKPGRLTSEEFEIMKTHAVQGSELLTHLSVLGSEEYMRYAYNICRYHHERWDGGGYPDGLVGDDIPICAQVAGLADCYDALTVDRVYKKAYSHAEAVSMILNGDCGAFSPVLLECFKTVRQQMETAANAYAQGKTPSSDPIRAPLAPPDETSVDTLQRLVNKYDTLLRYNDTTVVDLDLVQGVYHVAYNRDPMFDFISFASHWELSSSLWEERIALSDGTVASAEIVQSTLETFVSSGRRRQNYNILVRDFEGGFVPYTMTLLRPTETTKNITTIFKKKDETETTQGSRYDRIMAELMSSTQVCLFDDGLTMPYISRELENITGFTKEELLAQTDGKLLHLVPPESRDGVREILHRQLRLGNICETEFPLRCQGGTLRWVVGKGLVYINDQNEERIRMLFVDITDIRNTQEVLRRELDEQNLILAQSNDITFAMDFQADRLTCSDKWKQRFGYAPISDNMLENLEEASHFHPDDVPMFLESLEQLKNGTPYMEISMRIADINGHYQWSMFRAAAQNDENGSPKGAVGVIIDINGDMQESQSRAAQAEYDGLTQLLNKDACRRKVEAFLTDDATELSALAIVDLDFFKEVNDRYGHMFGDAVLERISGEIKRMFRSTDIIGRIGGDEFLVFMPRVRDKRLVGDRFELLVETISGILSEHAVEGRLSCSVGVAFHPEHGVVYEELFQRADKALYQAKARGRQCVRFYTSELALDVPNAAIGHRTDIGAFTKSMESTMMDYVFGSLYESNDVFSTIRTLLEQVGRQISVSRAYIFENGPDGRTCSNTFEWCADGVLPQIDVLQNLSYDTDLAGYRESFNERGILYSPDVTQLPRNVRDIVEPQGIRAMLHCAIRENGQFLGFVGFDDNDKIRLWTKEQIDLITFLSRIMSVFLLKARQQERLDVLVRDLDALLDRQDNRIYVVDEKTYELRYFNQRVMQMEPNAKTGEPCYRTLRGNDAPCETCPLTAEGNRCIIRDDRSDCRLMTTATTIHWENKPSWLITGQELEGIE